MPEKREETDETHDPHVKVLVTRAAPFWLPSKVERKADGSKGRPICGKLLLRPGLNRVKKSRWEATADHPTIKVHLEVGTLKLNPGEAESADHAHAPDPLGGLEDLTVKKAKPWIAKTDRVDTLQKWRTQEVKGKNRSSIVEAIDARLEELDLAAAGGEE